MRESEVVQSCPTLSDPMDCSPPGSSVHGIFQARVLERRRGGLKGPFEEEAELDNRFGLKDSASLCNLSFPVFRANGPVKAKLKLLGLP